MAPPKATGKAPANDPPADNPFASVFDDDDGQESEGEWWNEVGRSETAPSDKASEHRTTKWPKQLHTGHSRSASRNELKPERKYSVQKPIRIRSRGRQRIQNAKAGIKLVTSFSRKRTPSPQPPRMQATMGPFVDLATLHGLDEEGQQIVHKSSKQQHYSTADNSLSPSDQAIVIGISMPETGLSMLSPQTASTSLTKQQRQQHKRNQSENSAPSITVTTARGRTRVTSSIYSQAQSMMIDTSVPPVPNMPASYAARQSGFSQASMSSDSSEDVERYAHGISFQPSTSSWMDLGDDEDPVVVQTATAVTLQSNDSRPRATSLSTVATRKSKGWWNYIVSPFITRSNTMVSRPPSSQEVPSVPSLTVAAMRVRGDQDGKHWDQRFSPQSPSSVNSDEWWEAWGADSKHDEREADILNHPLMRDTRTSGRQSKSRGGLPAPTAPAIAEHPFLRDFQPQSSQRGNVSRLDTLRSQAMSDVNNNDREVPLRFEGTLPTIDEPRSPQRLNPFTQRSVQQRNPFVQQPRLRDLIRRSNANQPTSTRNISHPMPANPDGSVRHSRRSRQGNDAPPPYSPSPARRIPKYRAIFPPGHPQNNRRPLSPAPMSPGLQQAVASRGAIPMTEVGRMNTTVSPISPASSGQVTSPVSRPSNDSPSQPFIGGYKDKQPFIGGYKDKELSKKAQRAESKRRRWEKEDAVARKVGGCWRGRGCIPTNGCFGREGREGRRKRRWWILTIVAIILVGVAVPIVLMLLHKGSSKPTQQAQWVNLTSFPPMLTGFSTIAQPNNVKAVTGCVSPATQWSCALPKELQQESSQIDQPDFLMNIQWDNSEAGNATWAPNLGTRSLVGNAVSARKFIRDRLGRRSPTPSYTPNPAPPTVSEQAFLGQSTDGIISDNKVGEITPFYITFGSPADNASVIVSQRLKTRQVNLFPNVTAFIPAPSQAADGSASPANLLPYPIQQPIRLYDRGLATEHFGFYTYFDRSIFLKSLQTSDSSDTNGGATSAEASFRCTWAQTRFLVQMWTRMNSTASMLGNGTAPSLETSASYFAPPGSFPYPVTVTVDRHGGNSALKMLYCYGMDKGVQVSTEGQINSEDRGFGGTSVNPAPGLFSNNSDADEGGFDGGSGGCACQWSNFVKSS